MKNKREKTGWNFIKLNELRYELIPNSLFTNQTKINSRQTEKNERERDRVGGAKEGEGERDKCIRFVFDLFMFRYFYKFIKK